MISVEITSPIVEVVVENDEISVEDAVTTVEVVVESAIYTGGGGGGVTDHGDLTGLADDDHLQYQRAKSVVVNADYTLTDESFALVVDANLTVTLPDGDSNDGRTVIVLAGAGPTVVEAAGSDFINDGLPSYTVPVVNMVAFTSVGLNGVRGWITTAVTGNAVALPPWIDQSIPTGDVVTMGASGVPEWAAPSGGLSFGHGTTIDTNLTVTNERFLWIGANNLDITFPDAASNDGQFISVLTQGYTGTAILPSGTDQIAFNLYYDLPEYTKVVFQSGEYTGQWQWFPVSFDGMLTDLPYWYNNIALSVGDTLQIGSGGNPEWAAPSGGAPTAHASTHQDGGSDELALDASQTTSGVFNVARLGTGTSDAYHFLDGSGTWTDNVPVLIPCKNTSGGSIAKGAPVYVTGAVGATYVVEVAAADADTAAKMPAIGLLESTLANNATGYIVATGVLQGIDTSGYAINDTLYVSTTAGQLTATKPSGASDLIQNIARVTRVNSSTGSVVVLGAGRTNDVPNAIDAGKLTSGTVATARLASTGTASASTFLRGDGTWATPTGGGSTNASDLTSGTLANARLEREVRAAARVTARFLFI